MYVSRANYVMRGDISYEGFYALLRKKYIYDAECRLRIG